MGKSQKKLNYMRAEDWLLCKRRGFIQDGDSLKLDLENTRSAFLILPVIDSGEHGFFWDRIVLSGSFPEDAAVTIYAKAWDGNDPVDVLEKFEMPQTDEKIRKKLYDLTGQPKARFSDALLYIEGQKLFLAFEFSAGGRDAPELTGISLTVGGDHMTDYLPPIYRRDDFTKRFLSIFNSMFLDLESRIDDIPKLFDTDSDNPEIIRMLSSWLAISGSYYRDDQLKEWNKTAFTDYENLYTKKGIERSIKRMTGKDALIIEHFEVDPHSALNNDSKLYERLYGDDPFTFFVLLPEDTFRDREEKEVFLNNLNSVIPAGRKMELIILKQGIQLDWHSYLGVNSVIGDYTKVKIGDNTARQFDTVIGGDEADG